MEDRGNEDVTGDVTEVPSIIIYVGGGTAPRIVKYG